MSAHSSGLSGPIVPQQAARLQTLEAVRSVGSGFDPDTWHVIEERDSALISDELLNGAGSSKFVYSFTGSDGKPQAGVSVVGARHLASAYGGLKHRLVASVQKVGALHTFTSYPQPGMPMNVQTAVIYELEGEGDYYEAIIEICDVKTGNSVQMQKRESRWENKKDGSGQYEKIHYATVAQAKAYRNGILAVIPQDLQIRWKLQQLALHKDEVITASVMEQKRDGVLRFAASKGIGVDRHVVESLTIDQISGLSDAARAGRDDFLASARGLGVMPGEAGEKAQLTRAPVGKPAGTKPPSKSTSAPPSQPAGPTFAAYLVDGQGEVCTDSLTDAGAWAEAFAKLYQVEDDRPALLENNAEALRDARGIPAAAALLPHEDSGDTTSELPMPSGPRGPDLGAWIKEARRRTAAMGGESLVDWIGNNQHVWAGFPSPRRLEMDKMMVEACAAAGLKWTPRPKADAAEKPPHLENPVGWVNDQVAQLARCNTEQDVASLIERLRPRMEQVRSEDPALGEMFDKAAEARVQQLRPSAFAPDGGG